MRVSRDFFAFGFVRLFARDERKDRRSRTSSSHFTDSASQISRSRFFVLLGSRGLKRNFEQREVMGSMML
jgi:NhaP-type Na+/H+ or K+/H+ antiporter